MRVFFVLPVAIALAVVGVAALLRPDRVGSMLGERPGTGPGRAEVRALRGGVSLGVAALLVGSLATDDGRAVEAVVALLIVAAAAGRAISGLVDPPEDPVPLWSLVLVEVVMAALVAAGAALGGA